MMNIKRNNFWSAAKTIAATLFFGLSIGNAQGVFITEITDPNTNSLAIDHHIYSYLIIFINYYLTSTGAPKTLSFPY